MEYEIKISDDYKYYINDIEINESIFDDEKVEYFIKEREDFIDTLIDWIGDCGRDRENDKNLMKEDLKMLINRKEKFLFSSISTNNYVFSDDEDFNSICEEILKLNGELTKRQKN